MTYASNGGEGHACDQTCSCCTQSLCYALLHRARGTNPGPVMMITSGVHGNETASMAAAQKLADDCVAGRRVLHRGTLIIVPRVNQQAYAKKLEVNPI